MIVCKIPIYARKYLDLAIVLTFFVLQHWTVTWDSDFGIMFVFTRKLKQIYVISHYKLNISSQEYF